MNKIILIFIVVMFTCCEPRLDGQTNNKYVKQINPSNPEIYIISIDSCQYIYVQSGYASGLVHKENCKNHK
jgi:hypothetical protein